MVQFSSVAHSCLTLCDPMDGSTPGFPVHHQLPEFTQTHVHRVSDAIRPSHPHPWNPLGKNTEVGCPSLLQRIILTQEEHPGLLHCRQILYHLSYREVTDLGGAQILSQSPPCMPANPLRCVLGINLNPVSRISRPDSSPADHRSPGPALTSSKWPCPTPVSTRQAQWAFHDCSGQVWILFETLQGAPSPSLHPDQDPQCSHGEGGPTTPSPSRLYPPIVNTRDPDIRPSPGVCSGCSRRTAFVLRTSLPGCAPHPRQLRAGLPPEAPAPELLPP